MSMKILKAFLLVLLAVVFLGILGGVLLVRRGFRATSTPGAWEAVVARTLRDFAIPSNERSAKSPLASTSDNAQQGREAYFAQCANCHGIDGAGKTPMGI